MRAPVLVPVTTEKIGRLPSLVQPESTPAPYAPSSPPSDKISHGPDSGGNACSKSETESAQNRAPGIPDMPANSSVFSRNGRRSVALRRSARGTSCMFERWSAKLGLFAFRANATGSDNNMLPPTSRASRLRTARGGGGFGGGGGGGRGETSLTAS